MINQYAYIKSDLLKEIESIGVNTFTEYCASIGREEMASQALLTQAIAKAQQERELEFRKKFKVFSELSNLKRTFDIAFNVNNDRENILREIFILKEALVEEQKSSYSV